MGRSKERMNKRQEKLRRLSSDDNEEVMRRTFTKGRYLSMKAPKIIKYDSRESLSSTKSTDSTDSEFQVVVHDTMKKKKIGQQTRLEKPLEIYIDGPFGSPSSNIYRGEHALRLHPAVHHAPLLGHQAVLPQLQLPLDQRHRGLHVQAEEGGLLLDQPRPEELRVVRGPAVPARDRAEGERGRDVSVPGHAHVRHLRAAGH